MTVAFSNATRLTHYPSFDSWWQTQGEWVEEPNERRGGYSGVQRLTQLGQSLYAKKQTGHTYRSLLHPWGRPTVLRERDALLRALKAGVAVPEIVYCAAERNREGWRALLVTKATAPATAAANRAKPGQFAQSPPATWLHVCKTYLCTYPGC